ncbi:MAG: hypothetical protein HC875_22630 [Anaerolineales bacterium]|nr:hypothetical protein [Anaerolineales bacterium]
MSNTVHRIATGSIGASGRVTADFFTGSYRFSASVLVYKRRLADVLGDRITDYVDMVDIYVSRINNPGEIVATYQKGSLVKDEINFVLLSSEVEGTSKERFYVPNRVSLPIFVTVPSFEIQGKFQWMGDLEVKKIFASDTNKFLPILDASTTNAHFPKVTFEGPIVLVNKSKIELICIGDAS